MHDQPMHGQIILTVTAFVLSIAVDSTIRSSQPTSPKNQRFKA
jgi:hypothetical protein